MGFIGSWLVDPPWHRDFLAVGLYWLVGGALVFGLTAWHVYSAVVRARVLAQLYSRVQEVIVQKQAISAAPIARWILSAVSGLLGGVLLIPQAQLSNSRTLLVYGPVILVAILIIVFRKTPGNLIARVSIFRALFLFLLVAIKRHQTNNGQPYIYTPRGHTPLEQDDILIVLGTPEERAKLKVETKPGPLEQWQSKLAGLRRQWTGKGPRN